ncbi:MAG: tripartite tricarboxylate transporter substrate binding protein [Reyranella sp.]|jgi:tripartite-type tricarboxylate transporter receptor subunit TctC|uniref:Bug family tripartite tricarboxylate transporter substrate binding protein n=1 Tax=Reyranella sp. TaxID=1929291 RepID=UPI0025FA6ADE|nr:tripartite tricarboxylate transporter substrate binding protein [Reyranella sp.]MBR2815166.1 tripartite tricarboxylate transporter substrate binding protein [Reyranella sp.]
MLSRRSFVATAFATAALPAYAQTTPAPTSTTPWPSKPIRLVVPYAPGGTTDVVARVVADYLGKRLGQNIIVDNKPGKGAMVGTAMVAKALPDGYTLLMSVISGLTISPTLYGGGEFDPMADFIHVSIASTNPSVLVVNPSFEAKTFKDYVAYAKANPGKLAYATSGAGSSNHLLGARMSQVIGSEMVHIPYRGAGPAMVDTIAGNVPSMFDSLPSAAPHIKAGKVIALAVSGEKRSPAFPDVPTMKELGYPDLVSYSWFGISVPAKTPAPIVERIAADMQAILKEPAVVKRWDEIGAEPSTMTPAEVTRFVKDEIDKWTPVVKASGARPE